MNWEAIGAVAEILGTAAIYFSSKKVSILLMYSSD